MDVKEIENKESESLNQQMKDYKDRVFWIEGEIENDIMLLGKRIIEYNRLDKDISVEERIPIKIFISSNGGLLDETLALVRLIELSKTPVYTINACYSYSAAALFLISGHKRYALPGTKCLFHSGSGGYSGTFDQTQAAMDDYQKTIKQMQDYILTKTSIGSKLLNKKKPYDWYLSESDMVKYGVVDKIVTDLDEIL